MFLYNQFIENAKRYYAENSVLTSNHLFFLEDYKWLDSTWSELFRKMFKSAVP